MIILFILSLAYGFVSGFFRNQDGELSLKAETLKIGLFLGVCVMSRNVLPGFWEIFFVALMVGVGLFVGRALKPKPVI